ncbi:MAG: ABC transporter permease, partial [Lachnospiraceae bacterium]|nr:ABC transporter permease [Lachnospiraceae bacterium]
MGFQTSQIRGLLARQNMVLSLIGIVIGAPFGRILLQYMFDSNGDSYDYQVFVSATDYLLSGGLVLLISVSVSFLFNKKIKKLDMVEVLKGVE